jgi:DNA-binding PadR family transcriptional regulator
MGIYMAKAHTPPPPDLSPQWFQILLALADQPLHGYGIMNDVLARTDGRVKLWPGMLYGSLKRLTDAGLVEETDAPSGAPRDRMERRYYRITPAGRRALRAETNRLASYLETARSRNPA